MASPFITYAVGVMLEETTYTSALCGPYLTDLERSSIQGNKYAKMQGSRQYVDASPEQLRILLSPDYEVCFDTQARAAFIATHWPSGAKDIDDVDQLAFKDSLEALSVAVRERVPSGALVRSPCVVRVTSEESKRKRVAELHLKAFVDAQAYSDAAAACGFNAGDVEALRTRNANDLRHHTTLQPLHNNLSPVQLPPPDRSAAFLALPAAGAAAGAGGSKDGMTWMASRNAPLLMALPDDPSQPLNALNSEQVLAQLLHIKGCLRDQNLLEGCGYMCFFIVPCYHGGTTTAAALHAYTTGAGAGPSTSVSAGHEPPGPQGRKRMVFLPKSAAGTAEAAGAAGAAPHRTTGRPNPFGDAKPVDTAAHDRQFDITHSQKQI